MQHSAQRDQSHQKPENDNAIKKKLVHKNLAQIAHSKSSFEKYRLPKTLEQYFNLFFESIILKSMQSFITLGLTGLLIFSVFVLSFNQSKDLTLWYIGLPLIALCIILNVFTLLPKIKKILPD